MGSGHSARGLASAVADSARIHGGGPGRRGRVHRMPDLPAPPHSRRGGGELSAELGTRNAEQQTGLVPPSEFHVPSSATVPVLLFEQVTKWYGPVIGVNHVSLELRGGITGLV